jgi:hypothetical protein
MKRLAGMTLQRVLEGPEGLHKLLRALVDVCLAIEFAHGARRDPPRSQQ